MSDTAFPTYQHYGTAAERTAFVPDPPPGVPVIYTWFETDTALAFVYAGGTWYPLATPPPPALTGLSGDVLAGPGSGVVPSVLAASGVAPGTYTFASVQVDAKGRVVNASSGSLPSIPPPAITELTGPVTAGPGSGAVASVIQPGVVTPAMQTAVGRAGALSLLFESPTPLAVGYKAIVRVPAGLTLNRWSVMALEVGNIRFGLYADAPGTTYPPATSIVAAEFPELTGGASRFRDSVTLTGWTPVVPALHCLGVEVLTTSGAIKTVTLQLDYARN
jgi:hypothetical protein